MYREPGAGSDARLRHPRDPGRAAQRGRLSGWRPTPRASFVAYLARS